MSKAGWYPDPGGQQGLFRYWDGRAWSAATSPNPNAAPPVQGLGAASAQTPAQPGAGYPGQAYGQQGMGQPGYGPQAGGAYANYQQTQKKRSPVGWWIGAAALLVVIIIVVVLAVRSMGGNGPFAGGPGGGGQPSEDVCPQQQAQTASPPSHPNDGRVHGGPISYPLLPAPWGAPQGDTRVPFGSDVQSQIVTVEENYQPGNSWVASVLVGELQAGDGFYTPEQGAGIVVKCILGAFYGDNEVQRADKKNQKMTVDGHDAWIVESQLSFNIEGLKTKGELLIVVIVATGATAGLYYASIPDTRPELVQPARDALAALKVDQ
ncbi:hypothetical protein GCM10009841_27640 [Microlunatus panaciterrae]|uniref:DUF2510 domain-containing protein n=1 Tax=Microlunatus panaciterrae TaxID=400768 RepID=A0ABS2RIJ4_9ACTN|nr:hypothetical protein [Microlunatus panaciterrae]